ncbi:MAG: hypothetical protein Q9207_008260 [Kuettlingeria erythrocarpa]
MSDATTSTEDVQSDRQWLLALPQIPKTELPTANLGTSPDEAWKYWWHAHGTIDLLEKRAISFRKQGKCATVSGDKMTAKLYRELSEATKVLVAKAMTWCKDLERMGDEAERRARMALGGFYCVLLTSSAEDRD